jgi:hypothetical protein
MIGAALRQMTKTYRHRFRKRARRLFGVNALADFSLQIAYLCFLVRCVSFSPLDSASQQTVMGSEPALHKQLINARSLSSPLQHYLLQATLINVVPPEHPNISQRAIV